MYGFLRLQGDAQNTYKLFMQISTWVISEVIRMDGPELNDLLCILMHLCMGTRFVRFLFQIPNLKFLN